MASPFPTGNPPKVTLVSDSLVRFEVFDEGIHPGITGTIGLDTATYPADLRLPEAFKPSPYSGAEGQFVSLPDAVEVKLTYQGPGPSVQAIGISKIGTTPEDFGIVIKNWGSSNSGPLEFYIRFH